MSDDNEDSDNEDGYYDETEIDNVEIDNMVDVLFEERMMKMRINGRYFCKGNA